MASVRKTIEKSKYRFRSLFVPRIAIHTNHGILMNVKRHSRKPAKFAFSDSSIDPRRRWAHDVVMPHDGQRTPKTDWNVHGGSPSCSCVPKPEEFGTRAEASSKRDVSTPIASEQNQRCWAVTRVSVDRDWIVIIRRDNAGNDTRREGWKPRLNRLYAQ